MSLWQQLSEQISAHTQQPFIISNHTAVGGGCINQAYKVSDGQTEYFVKLNDLKHGDMFEAEAQALAEMAATQTVRVPQPLCYGETGSQTYLIMEQLEMSGRADPVKFGQQLAAMHCITAPQFGWQRDNTIGSTPQYNSQTDSWIEFWRHQRLLPQLILAEQNGYGRSLSPLADKLLADFGALFKSYQPQPSMLHGDLWGGNASALADSTPVIFDPAFYYGDRETDIAMTHLFGGFEAKFYAAYDEAWPLDDGFAARKTLYNLYHILNHLNLFGSGYLGQAVSMAEQVLSEV